MKIDFIKLIKELKGQKLSSREKKILVRANINTKSDNIESIEGLKINDPRLLELGDENKLNEQELIKEAYHNYKKGTFWFAPPTKEEKKIKEAAWARHTKGRRI
jgi:hypothetical protein